MTHGYSRREQTGWYFYDWANSVFSTTVDTLFLGPYLTLVAKAAAGPDGFIYPFGIKVEPRSYWGYLVSLSVLTQVIAMPVIGALADYGQRKREMLAVLAYIGAAATMAMYFVTGSNYLLGGALFLVANLAFGASMVVYNAFLPEIAPPEERDNISSKGWGLGYLGGGLMLALNLAFFSNAENKILKPRVFLAIIFYLSPVPVIPLPFVGRYRANQFYSGKAGSC